METGSTNTKEKRTKEKRIKREIANSNERRRMQSINAGFQKLKRLLPVNDGEKISKANILQHAADFITTIERDRIALYEQNTLIKRLLSDIKAGKLDVSAALDTIETTIPLNQSHVTASSSASSTPASTPTPTPSLGSQSRTAIIKKTTNNLNNNNSNNSNNNNNNNNSNNNNNNQNIGSVAEIISDKISTATITTSTKNGSTVTGGGGIAKAAIALPLEVPYTSEIITRSHHHHHNLNSLEHDPTETMITPRKRLKIEPTATASSTIEIANTSSIDSQEPTSKAQTLDTICKAIIEIEGDRVFISEKIDQHATTATRRFDQAP